MFTRQLATFMFLLALFLPLPAKAGGIPVFDAANLQQTTLSAIEAVNQTLKQIEQYALQLQQYEDMIKNSVAPAAYVWDQAQRTMNKVIALQNQLEFYTNQAGDVNTYLRKFGSVSSYRTSPYFKSAATDENRKALLESEELGSEAQKNANDNVVKTLENQQAALKEDAANLENLQANAQCPGPHGSHPARKSTGQPPSQPVAPTSRTFNGSNRCGKRSCANCCRARSTATGNGRTS